MAEEIITEGKKMRALMGLVESVAPTDLVIMLSGETGTGKGRLARLIHEKSLRKAGPFVTIDCASIPETLIESELFGFEKGAFTGATQSKIGKLESAKGGTIFFDEITNISMSVQKKLLRTIEDRYVEHLGGTKPIPVDFRIISAHNDSIENAIERGQFRKDLYHRMNQINLTLPPLRDRREDIIVLLESFSKELEEKTGRKTKALSLGAQSLLELYSWPGNVRELKNTFTRAFLLAGEGPILAKHLPNEIRHHANGNKRADCLQISWDSLNGLSIKDAVRHVAAEVETVLIKKALQDTNGNKSVAAVKLGIDEKTLYNKTHYRLNKT